MTVQLVLATTNVHKIRELRSILKKSFPSLDVRSLLDFPNYVPPEETGSTFEENATIKAVDAAKKLHCWALGDDSGLSVPALGGRPGVYSARYAGKGATDRDNRKKLLEEMRALQENDRQAVFICSLALASPEGLIKKHVQGVSEGTILTEERGSCGFGYDSLFLKYDYSKTFGELEEDVKNRISHRRKALDKLLITLESLCNRTI